MPKTRFNKLCATSVRDFSKGMSRSFHEEEGGEEEEEEDEDEDEEDELVDAVELAVNDPV